MTLNTLPIEDTKNSKKKNVWGVIIVFCILTTMCVVGYNQYQGYNNRNFNLNLTEAEKDFKMDKFSDAKRYYETALKYKTDVNVQTRIKLCDSLQSSLNEFNKGTDSFNKKDYLGAVSSFKGVIPEDVKRFSSAKDKIAESSKLYIESEFAQAKDYANKTDYQNAISDMDLILAFDPNNDNAKTLKTQYQADSDAKDAAVKAKALADEKAKELADAQAQAQADEQAKALARTQGVKIGMTQQQVLDSSWGRPESVNKTTDAYGTSEQWVYGGNNYLYFDNGILTSIQN